MSDDKNLRLIQSPTGTVKVLHMGTDADADELQRIFNGRHAFVVGYMAKMGWEGPPEKLSIERILEIRKQEGWKNPTLD